MQNNYNIWSGNQGNQRDWNADARANLGAMTGAETAWKNNSQQPDYWTTGGLAYNAGVRGLGSGNTAANAALPPPPGLPEGLAEWWARTGGNMTGLPTGVNTRGGNGQFGQGGHTMGGDGLGNGNGEGGGNSNGYGYGGSYGNGGNGGSAYNGSNGGSQNGQGGMGGAV